MLSRLSAILERVDDDRALLVLPGAHAGTSQAYDVLIPAYLREELLGRVGSIVTLHTMEGLESPDGGSSFTHRVIGFGTPEQRRFFELLTTVKGVGTKKALRALAAPIAEIARAIARRDAPALARLPGIGKRLAETIIAELHDRVDAFGGAPTSAGAAGQPESALPDGAPTGKGGRGEALRRAMGRAMVALVRLGESESEAQRLIRAALEDRPELSTADEIVAAALSAR